MNLAIGSMTYGRNHRLVFGSFIAALLAAVILTGIAVWQFTSTGSSATSGASVVALAGVPAVDTDVPAGSTIYIVASEAEKQTLLQRTATDAKLEVIDYLPPTVMVIDPLDQEFLQLILDGQIELGTFKLVDLR